MSDQGVLRQISEIQELSLDELRERWRELFDTEPPRYRKTVMIRRLCYRIQELAYGGISEATRSLLRARIEEVDGGAKDGAPARMSRRGRKDDGPVAGTRLVRTWHGKRYEATVVPGGIEYEGQRYRSLTAVAKAITGTHWNGRLFFGLTKRS